MKAPPLLAGEARGELMKLSAPLSFWGGVNPRNGEIVQVRHPQCGRKIAGKVLAMPGTIGSSSSAAVMLELIRNGHAPAALLLHQPDAILLVGNLVAREMGLVPPPAFVYAAAAQMRLSPGRYAIAADGVITLLQP